MSERRRYHQSELELFLKCGKAWEYRYVQGIRTPPKAAPAVGSSVDAAVTHNLIEKIKTGQDLPVEAVLDTFSSDFDSRSKEVEWGEDDPGKSKDAGVQVVKLHHEKVAPAIQPKSVQESFVIETDAGYDLGGTIDLTESSGIVADTKTSSRAQAGSYTIEGALQPALYDFAYEALNGKPAEGFRYDVLVKPSAKIGPEYRPIQGKVTTQNREWLFETITQVHKAIQAGVALPAASGSWWCSREWCGYANRCPKFRKG